MRKSNHFLRSFLPWGRGKRARNWVKEQVGLEQLIDPTDRAREARDLREEARDEEAVLVRDIDSAEVRLGFLAAHPGNRPGADVRIEAVRSLGLLMILGDAAASFVIFRAVWSNLPVIALGVGSIGWAMAVALLTEAALIMFSDDRRPERSIKRTTTLSLWLIFASLGCGAVVLLGRSLSTSDMESLGTTIGFAIMFSSGLFAAAGGAVMATAVKLGWPRAEREALSELREQLASVRRFLQVADAAVGDAPAGEGASGDGDELGADESVPVRTAAPRTPTHGGIVAVPMAVLAMLLLGACQPITAQRVGRDTTAVTVPVAAAAVQPAISALMLGLPGARVSAKACAMLVDRTRSVDSVHLQRAVTALIAAMPALVDAAACRHLVVAGISNEGAYTPRVWLDVPRSAARRDCHNPADVASVRGSEKYAAVLYESVRANARKQAVRRCRSESSSDSARFRSEWATVLRQAVPEMGEPPLAVETHSLIVEAAHSFMAAATVTYLVTDGIDTSGALQEEFRPSLIEELRQPGLGCLVILHLPARVEYGGAAAAAAAAKAWTNLPKITVVPYTYALAPNFWTHPTCPTRLPTQQ